jgi:pimeloyl-ACP methyl ester carboxylesterase
MEARFVEALMQLAYSRDRLRWLRTALSQSEVLSPEFAATLVSSALFEAHVVGEFSWPVYIATTCNDEPAVSRSELEREWRRYPLVSRWFTRAAADTCERWRARPAPAPQTPRPSATPVLFLSARDDVVTLPEWTDAALGLFPNASVYRSEVAGHGVLPVDACAQRWMQRFLDDPRPKLDVPCESPVGATLPGEGNDSSCVVCGASALSAPAGGAVPPSRSRPSPSRTHAS